MNQMVTTMTGRERYDLAGTTLAGGRSRPPLERENLLEPPGVLRSRRYAPLDVSHY